MHFLKKDSDLIGRFRNLFFQCLRQVVQSITLFMMIINFIFLGIVFLVRLSIDLVKNLPTAYSAGTSIYWTFVFQIEQMPGALFVVQSMERKGNCASCNCALSNAY